MSITYREIDLETAPEEDLHLVFDFSDKQFREFEPDDPLTPRPIRIRAVRQPNPENKTYRIVAEKDGIIVGNGTINFATPEDPGYEKNKEGTGMGIGVLKEYRRQGIASEIGRRLLEKVREYPDTQFIYTGSDNDPGKQTLEHLGGEQALSGSENRLNWEDIDWDLMQQWVDEGRELAKREGVTVEVFQECPEEIIEEYTALYSETMMQQPLGDMDIDIIITRKTRREQEERIKKIGLDWYTRITREKDGKISGLTEYMYTSDLSHKVMQDLTGVKEEYRDRGRGKWLKAEMLFQMKEMYEGVKYIVTGNATSNAPMLSINHRMGFKEHRASINYKFKLKELQTKLTQVKRTA